MHWAKRIIAMAALFWASVELKSASPPPGLYVENGILMKDSRPYMGIGVNYFDLCGRVLANPEDASSLALLPELSRKGIPFVRLMWGRYWPSEQELYLTNRAAFFERMDRVVRSAETNHIGLIPSLFWYMATAPDLMGEHIDQYGNPASKTIAYIREYTTAMVSRYRNSSAIWGWEFGNEYPLDADLPRSSQFWPQVVPELGTAKKRDEHDQLQFAQVQLAFRTFAEAVRALDSTRVIFTGNAVPRAAAWNNAHEKWWIADTPAQYYEILLRDNPDLFDSLSVHIYPEAKGAYAGATKSIGDLLRLTSEFAVKARKPLFLGEFGVSARDGSVEKQKALLQEFFEGIRRNNVPLAAIWVFDPPFANDEFGITFKNERSYMLDLIAEANRTRADGK